MLDIPELDLVEWWERDALSPVHHLLQSLHDEEHEDGSPALLPLFAELVACPERDAALDAELAPWLLRYLWEKTIPSYTQHAWRALQRIVQDPESLADQAEAILDHHPHGLLRAEVLAFPEARYPEYLEQERFQERMLRMVEHDPAPIARAAAWAFLDFMSVLTVEDLALICGGLRDPAIEVRERVSGILRDLYVTEGEHQAQRERAQRAALQDPTNRMILRTLLPDYLRSGVHRKDPERAAVALDLLAASPALPFRSELLDCLIWQVPWSGSREGLVGSPWFTGTPFGSGQALLDHLAHSATNEDTLPLHRAETLAALYTYGEVHRVDLQRALDLYLDPALDGEALLAMAECRPLVRAWLALPTPPVRRASTRLELAQMLLDRAVAAGHATTVRSLADQLMYFVRHPTMGAEPAQALLDAAIAAVVQVPGDASFGLYDLKSLPAGLRLDAIAPGLRSPDPGERQTLAESVAAAYARHPDAGRLELVLLGIGAQQQSSALSRLVDKLPARSKLPAPDTEALDAALRAALDAAVEEPGSDWYRGLVERWLAG
ncbi:MAG: hypothetical protein VX899_23565 [Myxococcota bacterium]|nr:hypothetical protein [Myxococcota bacterium]